VPNIVDRQKIRQSSGTPVKERRQSIESNEIGQGASVPEGQSIQITPWGSDVLAYLLMGLFAMIKNHRFALVSWKLKLNAIVGVSIAAALFEEPGNA